MFEWFKRFIAAFFITFFGNAWAICSPAILGHPAELLCSDYAGRRRENPEAECDGKKLAHFAK